jgi:hypothetical protein
MKTSVHWTPDEVQFIRANYANMPNAVIASKLGRTQPGVLRKAFNLGLKKSADFMKANNRGVFKPGHETWNKGMAYHAGGRSQTSQFKPGQINGRAATLVKPVGSYTINRDGCLEQKVSGASGSRHLRWRPVHRLVWERENGPVPAGHAVTFKPGRHTTDPERITLDALELVTRAELMRRNTVHRYGPEVARIAQLRGAINRQINQRIKP